MRIPKIFTTSPLTENAQVELDEAAAKHLGQVLRMKVGYSLELFNGDGSFYPAEIIAVSKKQVSVQVGTATPANSESPLHTHIGQVISRGDRMDYAVQKATEMGVNEITPLFSERCEVKLTDERQEKRQKHWQQVAISAAEQCGRACVPNIHPPQQLEDWLSNKDQDSLGLVLHHRDTQNLARLETPERVTLLIGPEGGLSEDEIAQAQSQGFLACTLGPRVLRTETAPVTALSVLNWLWGDFK